jgi:hypothetical protein
MVLQLTMYFKRAKFLKTLRGLSGFKTNLMRPGIQDFGTIMQIIFPVKLANVQDGQLAELRKSATRFSTLLDNFVTDGFDSSHFDIQLVRVVRKLNCPQH